MWVALLLDHPVENGGLFFHTAIGLHGGILQELDASIFHKTCKMINRVIPLLRIMKMVSSVSAAILTT
jgi:hypothetical protein